MLSGNARDFRQAGVSEDEIMRLCGWETRSMFDRYNHGDFHRCARLCNFQPQQLIGP